MSISNLEITNDFNLNCAQLKTAKVTGLSTPVADSDATNKAYVDASSGEGLNLGQVLTNGTDAGAEDMTNVGDIASQSLATTNDVTVGGSLNVVGDLKSKQFTQYIQMTNITQDLEFTSISDIFPFQNIFVQGTGSDSTLNVNISRQITKSFELYIYFRGGLGTAIRLMVNINAYNTDSFATLNSITLICAGVGWIAPPYAVQSFGDTDFRMIKLRYVYTAGGSLSPLIFLEPQNVSVTTEDFVPYIDNIHSLGIASKRWTDVYAVNATIQTSDANQKENVSNLNMGMNLIKKLEPKSFTWKNGGLRKHYGLLAQDVETVLKGAPFNDTNLVNSALVVKSTFTQTNKNEDGTDGSQEEKTVYGLRYGELIAPILKALKELDARIEALEYANNP
jgi:hypothetical protein